MASAQKRSTTMDNPQPDTGTPVAFTKRKILTFAKYAGRRDLLSVLLTEGTEYTMEQVDKVMTNFMKGKVN